MRPSLVVIPARLNSSRLPSKPLAKIAGRSMILHVWEKAEKADIGPVWVAAADEEIKEIVEKAGGQAVMTNPALPSGSDRVYEAVEKIDPDKRFNNIINLQGDMPACEPQAIIRLHEVMNKSKIPWDVMTLISSIHRQKEKENDSVVKVASGIKSEEDVAFALYFSRNPIPWGHGHMWKHLGIYGWRRNALEHFVHLPPSHLEVREKLEQLRALEGGMKIACTVFETKSFSVDTFDDLQRMRKKISEEIGHG